MWPLFHESDAWSGISVCWLAALAGGRMKHAMASSRVCAVNGIDLCVASFSWNGARVVAA